MLFPKSSTPQALATGIGTIATNKYNNGYSAGKSAGVTEAQAVTWTAELYYRFNSYYDQLTLDLTNVTALSVMIVGNDLVYDINSTTNGITTGTTLTGNITHNISISGGRYFHMKCNPPSTSGSSYGTINVTYQAKKLR